MAAPRHRDRHSRSLSIISNQSGPKLDGNYDRDEAYHDSRANDHAVEGSSWDIIDREIYEWQYVCRTGRPYWWSPKSKHGRLNMGRKKLDPEPGTRIWVGDTSDPTRDEYKPRRRAVSDGFLTDPSAVGDKAHMVAIQLLSSCFTLPPASVLPSSSQNRGLSEKNRSASLTNLNSTMISSLKMHTRYRYSPCYGHQGRNTSPEQISSDPHDSYAPSSALTPLERSMHTPDIGTSDNVTKRRRVHRALHVTEGSATNCSLDYHTDEYLKSCTSVSSIPSARASRFHQQFSENDNFDDYRIPQTPVRERQPRREIATDAHHGRIMFSDTSFGHPQAKDDLKLKSHSEPHHDYMQPVKDIAVKRWNKLRRRLGSSQNSNAPVSEFGEGSAGSVSRASSPAIASHGKERRRRARASGDISSYESTAHYNSPASSHFSPVGSEASDAHPTNRGMKLVNNTLEDHLPAAISLALESDQGDSGLSQNSASLNARLPPESCKDCQPPKSLDEDSCGSIHHRSVTDTDQGAQNVTSSVAPGPSSSGRRSRSRQTRKSMLSEVFTAEDLDDEIEAKALGTTTALPSARDEQAPASAVIPVDSGADSFRRTKRQPGLLRTSTSGTQVFTPSDEGIEIDGLPVGLCRHAWDESGKKRERSYL